ncbi:hypothetical protein A2872_02600 [Candidatus Gottesmanbacteria bacterium RIFCSPHIGHO2_01_FULL_42_12]|uniref:BioF2-like acetyltransferase domain-containing protein n=1 Tax=Candidatus Gottesmanbacteria bacterium RIFCSPHIGHO2_01_FULL_42_12 TaxID=1798377 RepID=A0A1F5Z0E5_9BACT|nr:MAG: hypothetical protein A2872_02600 [Candidatus Gottesmanbacteria bacterium RIFCSPHIGHO2_01_FULL_42_12]
MPDVRQSDLYAKYMQSLGWIVEKIDDTNVFIKKILFFSVIKIQRPNILSLSKLKLLKNKYRAIKVNIEPGQGWRLLPTKTIIIDLLNLNIPKDTRYEIRKSQNTKLLIKVTDDIDGFYKMLQETMRIGHWEIPIKREVTNLYKAFKPYNSAILMTQHSGCLMIWDKDTAHYMYAANTTSGLKLGAAYLTLWDAIKFCQKKGLKYLDLEGIYDERFPSENKNWQGFTKFKMGWGGEVVEY